MPAHSLQMSFFKKTPLQASEEEKTLALGCPTLDALLALSPGGSLLLEENEEKGFSAALMSVFVASQIHSGNKCLVIHAALRKQPALPLPTQSTQKTQNTEMEIAWRYQSLKQETEGGLSFDLKKKWHRREGESACYKTVSTDSLGPDGVFKTLADFKKQALENTKTLHTIVLDGLGDMSWHSTDPEEIAVLFWKATALARETKNVFVLALSPLYLWKQKTQRKGNPSVAETLLPETLPLIADSHISFVRFEEGGVEADGMLFVHKVNTKNSFVAQHCPLSGEKLFFKCRQFFTAQKAYFLPETPETEDPLAF
ncbi:MAG: elongator complex protein 4 [Amphiamblys sp. WSBS2006]|nr:MAG: elongator complex protein 4 [Amphiamblys sp. WSBS2006]